MNEATLDLTALRSVIAALDGGLAVVSDNAWFDQQSTAVQDTLIAGVIQSFEFVYELGVKMIRHRIELDSASPTEIDGASFRDILRIAAERGLIADVEAWFQYRKMRNMTAHTYDRAKAREIYRDILTFIGEAHALLARLEARNG